MKKKTSITLSEDLLRQLDRYAGAPGARSAYIERVLRKHLRHRVRKAEQRRDLDRLNAAADRLNREMSEVLEFQAPWADREES